MNRQRVLTVGCWHLGSTIACCLAELGHDVSLWDQDSRVAESWKQGKPPVFEPGLEVIAKKSWNKTLRWATDLHEAASKADWVLLAYDTPINEQDEVVLDAVEKGFDAVQKAGVSENVNLFFTCQLPVGTTRAFIRKLQARMPSWRGHAFYQPENLRLGNAIESFLRPDRAVLGIDAPDPAEWPRLEGVFRNLIGNDTLKINRMTLESAEMVKHALNSFLANCVVFANEVSNICEKEGANAWDVFDSLRQDSRVGPRAFLKPGLGFAGGTLARDVKILSHLSAKANSENTDFFAFLYAKNADRNRWVLDTLVEQLGDLRDRKIVLMGVTYKPNTSTVRRSPAIEIASILARSGAHCRAIDPMADLTELGQTERAALAFELEKDWDKAFQGADAAVVVTDWPQFKELDWPRIHKLMARCLVIDTKNQLTSLDAVEGAHRIIPGLPSSV